MAGIQTLTPQCRIQSLCELVKGVPGGFGNLSGRVGQTLQSTRCKVEIKFNATQSSPNLILEYCERKGSGCAETTSTDKVIPGWSTSSSCSITSCGTLWPRNGELELDEGSALQ